MPSVLLSIHHWGGLIGRGAGSGALSSASIMAASPQTVFSPQSVRVRFRPLVIMTASFQAFGLCSCEHRLQVMALFPPQGFGVNKACAESKRIMASLDCCA